MMSALLFCPKRFDRFNFLSGNRTEDVLSLILISKNILDSKGPKKIILTVQPHDQISYIFKPSLCELHTPQKTESVTSFGKLSVTMPFSLPPLLSDHCRQGP